MRPKGFQHTEETKRKLSEKNKGQKRSLETRKRISEMRKGVAPRGTGWKQTEETKEKLRQAHLGMKRPLRSKAYRDKISKLHKGKVVSEETRKKMSKARMGVPSPRKGVKLSDETKGKLIQANLGKKYSEEVRRKVSEAGKGRVSGNKGKRHKRSPEYPSMKGSNNPNWKGGTTFEKYPQEWNDELRDIIRERDNFLCKLCGIKQDELVGMHKRLSVHHVDYNKRNLCQSNLISLCIKCHGKTHHRREYWKEHFNKQREEIK